MVMLKSTEVQQHFGKVMDRALAGGEVVVERYGAPRVVILNYQRYEQLVQAERALLRTRLQEAAAGASARAARLTEQQVEKLIEEARSEVAPTPRRATRKRDGKRAGRGE